MEDLFKDWLFRYSIMFRFRYTDKQKKKFLNAFVHDISLIRDDIKVIEYKTNKKYNSRNIYVGNIKSADYIIYAYYDTPPAHFGDYILFNREKQGKQTMKAVLFASIIWILLGILVTFVYINSFLSKIELISFTNLFVVIFYLIYFLVLARLSKGYFNFNNLIRNTSSILLMLKLIKENKSNRVAYAFYDEGSYGEKGFEVIKRATKKNAKFIFLDCIGADASLNVVGNLFKNKIKGVMYYPSKDEHNYIFCGERNEEFYLDKEKLNEKEINYTQFNKTIEILKEIM